MYLLWNFWSKTIIHRFSFNQTPNIQPHGCLIWLTYNNSLSRHVEMFEKILCGDGPVWSSWHWSTLKLDLALISHVLPQHLFRISNYECSTPGSFYTLNNWCQCSTCIKFKTIVVYVRYFWCPLFINIKTCSFYSGVSDNR